MKHTKKLDLEKAELFAEGIESICKRLKISEAEGIGYMKLFISFWCSTNDIDEKSLTIYTKEENPVTH